MAGRPGPVDGPAVARALTDAERHCLLHALGAMECKRPPATFYRDHFVTDASSVDHVACMRLHELGLMTRRAAVQIFGGMDCFNVTGRGEAVARACLATGARR